MIAAQDGDVDAYERLLRDVLPSLRQLAGRIVGDPALRDDVVQTAMLHLHRARHTYRPERPFGPWLRTVTRNAAKDALRAAGRRRRFERPWETHDEASAEFGVDGSPPHPAAPLSPRLQHAVDSLPPRQRQAVELLHLDDLSAIEAASIASSTPGAMRVRAHRAIRSLREWLEGHAE